MRIITGLAFALLFAVTANASRAPWARFFRWCGVAFGAKRQNRCVCPLIEDMFSFCAEAAPATPACRAYSLYIVCINR